MDDRGHFYKPLQRGPRGDRERQFYTTVAALLAAEQDAAAAAAAAAVVQRSQPMSMPHHNGDASGPAGSAGGAPWHPRRLRQLFPSFRGILKLDTGPVAVAQASPRVGCVTGMLADQGFNYSSIPPPTSRPPLSLPSPTPGRGVQRDELGLLSGALLTKLGFGAISPVSSPQPTKPLSVAASAAPAAAAAGAASSPGAELEDGEPQLGRSPDSDECGERTGRHLMESFSFKQSPCRDGCACCERSPAGSPGGAAELRCCGSQAGLRDAQHGAAASAFAGPAEQARQQEGAPAAAAAAAGGERDGHHGQHGHGGQGPLGAHTHTLAEHAQAAALLGQPFFVRALSVGSDSMPFRSPFVSELLHHSHQPPPSEAGDDPAAPVAPTPPGSAAGSPERGALAGALAQADQAADTPAGSSEAIWLRDGEREGGSRGDLSGLPFSVRNAPLLRVIPKFCEWGTAGKGQGAAGGIGCCRPGKRSALGDPRTATCLATPTLPLRRRRQPRLPLPALPMRRRRGRGRCRRRRYHRGRAQPAGAGGPGTGVPPPLHRRHQGGSAALPCTAWGLL